ncbi:MAG: hypothetical protein H0W61_16880 [Bacteroidetes bacterium]|nr:hypothetical protein [Bacteroidota bacterium]
MAKQSQKPWRYKSIPVKHRGVKLAFTIYTLKKVPHSKYPVFEISEISTIALPTNVYNQILRKLKIDSLLTDSGQITVDQFYKAAKEYNSRFQITLENFEIV